MEKYKKIGIAGGWIYQVDDGKVRPFLISRNSVSGAVQLFSKECYEQIGGYLPIPAGGVDSAAEIMAREKGWEVRTIRELIVLHHGKMLTGNKNSLQTRFNKGCLNYILGYHPLFQMASCLFRMFDPPFIIGSIHTMLGYVYSFLKKRPRVYSKSIIIFLRKEQKKRLCDLLLFRKDSGDFF